MTSSVLIDFKTLYDAILGRGDGSLVVVQKPPAFYGDDLGIVVQNEYGTFFKVSTMDYVRTLRDYHGDPESLRYIRSVRVEPVQEMITTYKEVQFD